MDERASEGLARLVAAVQASAHHRGMSADIVRAIGIVELGKRPGLKEAIKATKNCLHQVSGSYVPRQINANAWIQRLEAHGNDRDAIRRWCLQAMDEHLSTRERGASLDSFYETVCQGITPPSSVLDIACGLHPLGLLWMPLAPDVVYDAYDIDERLVDIVRALFTLLHVPGEVAGRNVLAWHPSRGYDVAFLMKCLPCFEQLEKGASRRLLMKVPARHLIVSYPVTTLGGRRIGMAAQYESDFREAVSGQPWEVRRFTFPHELVFRITKHEVPVPEEVPEPCVCQPGA